MKNYVNILTGDESDKLPDKAAGIYNPSLETCVKLGLGWRKPMPVPAVKPDYERLAPVLWVQSATEPLAADPVVVDTLISDRLAKEAKDKADADKAQADADKAAADALKVRDDLIAGLTFKSFTDPKQQDDLGRLAAVVAQLVRHEL